MTSSCNMCTLQKKIATPIVWCLHCDLGLCSPCDQHHSLSPLSRDHNTVPFVDYEKLPKFVRNLAFKCKEHGEKYQYYCRFDDEVICKICKKSSLNKCSDTPLIDDVIHNIKSSFVFEETQVNLKKMHQILLKATEDRKQNMISLYDKRSQLLTDIVTTKEKIINYMNELEQNAKSDLENIFSDVEEDITNTLKTIAIKEQSICEIIESFNDIETHTSNLQSFIGIKEIEKIVNNASTQLRQMSTDGRLDQILLGFNRNENTEEILSELESLLKVKKISSKQVVPVDMTAVYSAQHEKTEAIKLQIKKNIPIVRGFHYSCSRLSSGATVVADNMKNKLKIMNENGSLKSALDIDECVVFNVAALDDDQVIISGGWKRKIYIVNIPQGKLTKTFNTGTDVTGISYSNGYILFCAVNKGIKKVNLKNGKINDVMQDEAVTSSSYISAGNDMICYTCPDTHTVTGIDSQSNVLFQFKDESVLTDPRGITFDDRMNIYVVGFGSRNLVVLFPNGKTCIQVLRRDDGLRLPTDIHYDRHTKELVVVSNFNTMIQIYDVLQL